jgi:hypothetical protein
MANECIEYKYHRDGEGNLQAPAWMSDGGYYPNPTDKTIVGFVPVEQERDWFVPDSVSMLTEQEFVNRCMAMHNNEAFEKIDDTQHELVKMTNAEVDAQLREFYQSKTA